MSTIPQANIEEATSVILQANLSRLEHKVLVDFVEKAVSPELAASEVLKRVNCNADRPVEEVLRGFKNDWQRLVATVARKTPDPSHTSAFKELIYRRDQSRCCLTPSGGQQLAPPVPTFILPPTLLHVLEHDVSRSLMDAFMTPSGVSRLRDMLTDTSDQGLLANTWLLAPGVSHAFRAGHLQVQPRRAITWNEFDPAVHTKGPSKAETEDPQQLPLPSPFLFRAHHGLVNALHNFRIEEPFLSPQVQVMCRRLWHLLPKFIRTFCYRRLLDMGKSRYPQEISFVVHRLPLGLYAKRCDRTQDNEPNALRLLEREAPSIPAPRLIDTFQIPATDGGGDDWFIMTGLPGLRVHHVLHRMSYAERDQLADDLRRVLDRMHRIPNRTPYAFANVSGGTITDRRASGPDGCGPYNSEADLNSHLAKGVEKYLKQDLPNAFSRAHKSVFTHGDLFFSNVLVDGGRLSGIVDWENAGFMPEYWDFTKAMWASKLDKDAHAVYRRIWGHRFDEELEVERWLWRVFPFGGP
ncbi:kinase-like domain-containing protein [Chaetomidium leptoderma]|uniref:Kinase-like domain-containing protein n=1 Tax=Chaetomidium leptoderma TaxID=669021 RepID=A0AAN6VI65_9PEZI|nr:kinase-like domain-containing protein [Chaetomidium leptoderma]